MSIRSLGKNKNGKDKWQIDYYPHGTKGKRIRNVFIGSESEAKTTEIGLRRAYHGNYHSINPKIIDILPEFLEWLRLHRAYRTYKDYKLSLKWLLPYFGKLPINEITPILIDRYKQSREGKNRAIIKELNYLKGIISFMVKRNYANPLTFKIEMVRYKRPIPDIPHPSDIDKFLQEIKHPIKKALALLMWQTGLRYNDASHLKWENITWNKNIFTVIAKGNNQRICVLTEDVRNILIQFKKDNGFVFVNPKTGNPYLALNKLFKQASDRAGIKRIHPHLLRHAFGTYVLDATGDLRLVRDLLGHKDITTTQFYTQITLHRMQEGIAKTADYISHLKPPTNP